LKKLI